MGYYNRYDEFITNGDYIMVPHIRLTNKFSDRSVVYKMGKTRPTIWWPRMEYTRRNSTYNTIPINDVTRGI